MIKKGIAVILILACFLSLFAGQAFSESTVKYGDINFDQKVDSTDFSLLKRYVLGMINLTDAQLKAADVNADGKANSRDMAYLKRKILDMISLFPAEEIHGVVLTASGVGIESYDTNNKTITFDTSLNGRKTYTYSDGVDPLNKRFDKVDITYKDGVILTLNDTTTIAAGYINKVNDTDDTAGTLSINSLKSITFWFFGSPEYTSKGICYTNKEVGLNKAVVKFNGNDLGENNVKQLIGKYAKVYLIGNSIYRIEAFDLNSVNGGYGGIITSISGSYIKYQKYDSNDAYLYCLDTATDLSYVFVDGVQKTIAELKADMFFEAWQSSDGKKLVIAASTKKATGKLNSIECRNATVGGTRYDTVGDNFIGGTKYVSLNNGIEYNKDTLVDLSGIDVTAYIGIDNKIHFIKGTSTSAPSSFMGLLKTLKIENRSITVVKDVNGVSTEVEYAVKTDSDDLRDDSTTSTTAAEAAAPITWSTFINVDQGGIAGDKTGYTSETDAQSRIYKFYVNSDNKITKIERKAFVGEIAPSKFNRDSDGIEFTGIPTKYVDGTVFFDLKDNKVRYWKDIEGNNTSGVNLTYATKDNGYLDVVAFTDDSYKNIRGTDNVTGEDLFYALVSGESFDGTYYNITPFGGTSIKLHKDDASNDEYKQLDKKRDFICYVKDGEKIQLKSVVSAVYSASTGIDFNIVKQDQVVEKHIGIFEKKDGLSVKLSGNTNYYPLASDCKVVRVKFKSNLTEVDASTVIDPTDLASGNKVALVMIGGKVRNIYLYVN
ncbi:MAG TPA: dockerin type I repeat-containing protein [Clostridia bacterium]